MRRYIGCEWNAINLAMTRAIISVAYIPAIFPTNTKSNRSRSGLSSRVSFNVYDQTSNQQNRTVTVVVVFFGFFCETFFSHNWQKLNIEHKAPNDQCVLRWIHLPPCIRPLLRRTYARMYRCEQIALFTSVHIVNVSKETARD